MLPPASALSAIHLTALHQSTIQNHALLLRAGGGEGFGGDVGGGGGFGGGGGGGFGPLFFIGSGGGGGGSASVVGFAVFMLVFLTFLTSRHRRHRMRGVNPTPVPYPHSDRPAYEPGSLPWDGPARMGAAPPTQGPSGLQQITAHDPAFNIDAFKSSVERVFFIVEEAWSQCKPDMSRRVMADGLWQQHKAQIDAYVAKGQRNVLDGLAVGRVTLVRATSDQQYDTVTCRILAACADYDVNATSGKVTRGDKHQMTNWQEDWVFQRSSSATTKTGGGTMEEKCPNCGAPLDLDLAGVCKYCRAPVMSGAYDWVLTRIDQV